jgi:hypothetical protein
MDKSMKTHPNSTIVMDANTFEVVATGTDTNRLSKRSKKLSGTVVFQRPNPNHIMVL